ncbi:hypothetical protein ABEB36_004655 [Hypothenemus hampei]|uniref:MADF domain-containing protein n=1 Tax=Hypothenemus hampei TaxID=57062 RepID=A0ABD1F5K4_HYPHA
MEHLIEAVRKYPCLWKLDMEEYKNNEVKEAAWRSIINECDITDVKEAKAMWKKLRDGHRQALSKKKTTTGQAACSDRLWKYEKQMEFLIPQLTNRPRSTNAIPTQDISQINIDETVDNTPTTEENLITNIEHESQQTIYTIPKNKRKNDKVSEYIEQEQKRRDLRSKERDLFRRELLTQQQSVKPIEVTALKKFFDSMCDETYNLLEYLQMKIQRQIFNVVMEAREANLQRQSENPVISVPTQSQHTTYVSLPSSSASSAADTNNEIYFISTSSPILSPSDDHFVSQTNTN